MLRDVEVENGGAAPRIYSMDEYFMTEVEKVFYYLSCPSQTLNFSLSSFILSMLCYIISKLLVEDSLLFAGGGG